MPLLEPNNEDVRKLHNEINQINHERFLLTTGAITAFAILESVIVSKEFNNNIFPFILAIVLQLIIFSLYIVHHTLWLAARTYAIYLAETGTSIYEREFPKIRPRAVYQRPQTFIFMMITFLGMIFPLIILTTHARTLSISVICIIAVLVGVISEILMYLWGFCGYWNNDAYVRSKLETLKNEQ